ncbi:hypothetical protein CDL12_04708 [Handroanthus impetiginosus]|uniref:Bromo domain-containing protein n=1 Tax=Handroanthus impetiginosus TaxID=429701 RepID=A0A2G9HYK5_9LAMI|nr:hypothetical protein CDL12_04708 [Handroanthus impetiginosus]
MSLFLTMSAEDNTVRRNLKFKITTRGIRVSEAESCENVGNVIVNNGKGQRVTWDGNKHTEVNVVNSSKRRAEMSLDDQKGKRRKMDCNLKLLCGNILKELINHPDGWIFSEPVDPVKLKIPDYFSIIAQPMDLGTIRRKLEGNMYFGAEEFVADVRLTFSNAMSYNPPGHKVHYLAKKLDGNFSRKWKLLEAKLKQGNKTAEEASFVNYEEKNGPDAKHAVERSRQDMKPIGPDKAPLRIKPGTCMLMSFEEKQKFRLELVKVLSRNMTGSLRTVFQKFGLTGLNKERLVSYINSTDDETLRKLKREINVLLDARDGKVEPARTAQNKCPSSRKTAKKERNQSAGASAKLRQSNGSTQASTSDISSERSSEHDQHDHSGDSRLDCEVKCSSAFRTSSFGQDSDGPGVVLDEENGHQPSTPAATCAFVEGQLSPKKALRAAMLKSRFADTIFKATHKVLLERGDKRDRLRMQQEMEKLEREQQKEKAWIEAEMKAAKSKEQDLKMRRERERAALEKMQKTVDICENADILKELEMLYYASLSAPLEQLGLHMKYDNLEEDDESLCGEEGEIL